MKFAIDGITVDLVEAHDRNVIHLQKDGYEPHSLAMWARLIQPDSVVLDIGAYTGLYSIIAAKCGARVLALEPMPAQQWRLRVNAARNKVRIEVLPVAASDREGDGNAQLQSRCAAYNRREFGGRKRDAQRGHRR